MFKKVEKKKFKVKLIVSFEYEAEVEVEKEEYAKGAACDMAMDYLDLTIAGSQEFNQFWEYDVECKVKSIEETKQCE